MLGIFMLLVLSVVEVIVARAALKAGGEEVKIQQFEEFFEREHKS
ncbi:hypothetical protein [Domibacillus aminovorans]|nr:hypothetical protein [Domibacillus aminovorans]